MAKEKYIFEEAPTKPTYSDKLKDPRWQKKRLEVLNRDQFTCQCCGTIKIELQVHHIEYRTGEPWEIENELLITLCRDCHSIMGDKTGKQPYDSVIWNDERSHAMAYDNEFAYLIEKGVKAPVIYSRRGLKYVIECMPENWLK